MAHSLHRPSYTKYVVAHNDGDICHYSVVTPIDCFDTGQPKMEVFDTEAEAIAAFPCLESAINQDDE